ncbi:hypothetical protein CEP54_015277 [Fusarium duplospermum]|uniref:Uncharacterized protein n=1 Tax=Fusarium duplospermum TaxID=1325734 RepID=A0A428NQA8_9HYPO|nr:hypothetical protein CEP54_015277 [Fusarium duplospermum]
MSPSPQTAHSPPESSKEGKLQNSTNTGGTATYHAAQVALPRPSFGVEKVTQTLHKSGVTEQRLQGNAVLPSANNAAGGVDGGSHMMNLWLQADAGDEPYQAIQSVIASFGKPNGQ